jgi:hypothetical protein
VFKELQLIEEDSSTTYQIQTVSFEEELVPCCPNGPAQENSGFCGKL